MSSTYSTSLKLELIGNGDQSGVWGNTTNNNLGALLEQAITGVQYITMTNANYSLSNYNGTLDEARNPVIIAQGTNSAIYQVIAPLVNKQYIIYNNTVGGYAITIGGTSGSTVTIPNGVTATVYCDGINFYSGNTGTAGSWAVTGNETIGGSLGVTGNSTFTGTTTTTGTATFNGAAAFNGATTVPTQAVNDNSTKAASTAFVNASITANPGVLTGSLLMWPTTSAPTGYLNCDGTAVSRTTYASLFAVVSTTFGTGDGSTTFNLPNYTSRMPYGTTIGATGGSADAVVVTHTHTATSTVTDPGHTHTANNFIVFTGSGQTYGAGGGKMNNNTGTLTEAASTGISVNSGGSGTAMNTISPYLGINFIIKT